MTTQHQVNIPVWTHSGIMWVYCGLAQTPNTNPMWAPCGLAGLQWSLPLWASTRSFLNVDSVPEESACVSSTDEMLLQQKKEEAE